MTARIFVPSALVAAVSVALAAEDVTRSVWEGVYTTEQAERGKVAYAAECVRCHGKALEGLEDASPLKGVDFLTGWNGKSVGRLVDVTRRTMPPETAGTLSRPMTLDLVAFMLAENGFPAGKTPLDSNAAALRAIMIEAKKPASAP